MPAVFIEQNCTIEHEGKTFESGGSFICDCSDGYRRGVVYAKPPRINYQEQDGRGRIYPPGHENRHACRGIVTTWHGEKIAAAGFGAIYQGNYCKMRAVSFTLDGIHYTGRYCPDTSTAVRVRSTKKVPKAAESIAARQ